MENIIIMVSGLLTGFVGGIVLSGNFFKILSKKMVDEVESRINEQGDEREVFYCSNHNEMMYYPEACKECLIADSFRMERNCEHYNTVKKHHVL